jgi:S-ribosylhomocysteine lyase
MAAPFLRVQHESVGQQPVQVWDLRICQPNVSTVDFRVLHSMEHFLSTSLREMSDSVVAVAPLGCQTGLYIVTARTVSFDELAGLVADSLLGILSADAVPLADIVNCGAADNHSLSGAKMLAEWLLHRRADWHDDGVRVLEGDP